MTLGDEQRIEVPDRYGFSAFTFSSTDGGAYSFDYYRDSIDNRDTYSQLWLFERNGATYIPVEVDSDRAVTEDFAPSFDPYTRNGQFGNGIAWQVGAESNDTTLSLSSDTEYLLIADSWLHLPATGDGQIDSGSFRIRVNGP